MLVEEFPLVMYADGSKFLLILLLKFYREMKIIPFMDYLGDNIF